MPLDGDAERDPAQDVVALEQEVGVRQGLFVDLLTEGDDWSFVIKIHALLEAAISHLLAGVLRNPKLIDIFAHLELSNERAGKIAFAKALDCLEADERHTIRKLSELRNQLVHDVSNVAFSFHDWAANLDPNQAKQFAKAFTPSEENFEFAGKTVSYLDFFRSNPRISIWLKFLFLLSLIYQRKDLAQRLAEVDHLRITLAETVVKANAFRTLRHRKPTDDTTLLDM